MTDKKLSRLLEQLHDELENAEAMDEKGRDLLRRIGADIHGLLESSGGGAMRPQPSMLHQLQDSIDHFEVTHPTLTALLSQMLNTLSNAGI